jgi:hypothetical protein
MHRALRALAVLAVVGVAWLLAWRHSQQAALARRAQAQDAAASKAPIDEATPGASEPSAPLHELVRVEPATLDFGDLVPDLITVRSVTLRNLSDHPVRITRAVSDCGCTAPSAPTGPIPAGGAVETEIQMRPGSTQGERLTKRVTFEVEGGLPAFCTVTGQVGMYLQCAPLALQAPADSVADAPPGEITLESRVDIPFEVTEVDPSIEVDAPSQPATRQVVRIDWKLWREAGRPMQVRIVTDHAGAPPITVVLRRHD